MSHESQFLDDPEFQSLLVGCLESLQRGETIDRDALARDFPRYADEIHQFLNDRQLLEQVAADFGDVEPSNVAISAYEKTLATASDANDFVAGDTVRYIGEYEILEEIARGGMGVVFKARQQKLKRIVALKMILAGKLADTSDIERFQREARAAGRLKHPAIVPVHEIGEHDGRHYFTMDFVEGQSLADAIREETLSPRAAADLVRKTAEAVQYAHGEGTVHRDLKPANILIDPKGQPQVTDFGLAKMLESVDEESRAELTASGQILGTPSYMSPEQASGKQELVGPASDIYSLGAILYACLTGRAPFVADSPVDTLLQVMKKEPVSPRELNPSVPKDLETICLKCLTKEPHKRYGTAQELADDLNRFLEGHPVVARPVGRISRTARWCRRNKSVASLLCLLFLSMAVGTYVSASYAVDAVRHAQNEAQARAHAETAKEQAEDHRRQAEQAQRESEEQRDEATRARRVAEQRGAELRRQLYIAEIPRAQEAWNDGNTARVRQLLEQHVPEDGEADLRGFEWHYLNGLTKSSRLAIDTGRRISGVDISPDGQMIATLGGRKLLLQSLEDGVTKAEFPVPQHGEIAGVAFDSTSQYVCVDSDRVRLWNLGEKRLVWEYESATGCDWCAFTPEDSRIVAVCNDWKARTAQLTVRATESGKLLREIPVATLAWSAALDSSGHSVYVACQDRMLRQWDLQSGTLLREWPCNSVEFAMAWDPTRRFLLLGSGDGHLAVHDTIAGKQSQKLGQHRNSFRGVAFDASGTRFAAVGRSQAVHIFDAKSGEPIRELRGHAAEIMHVAYRPDVHEVVTADVSGMIHVWNSSREQGIVEAAGSKAPVAAAQFSPDGRWFAYCEGNPWAQERKGAIRLFDLQNMTPGPILDGHEKGVFGLAMSDDTIYSAGADGKLMAWDSTSLEHLWSRTFEKPLGSLAIAADEQRLVVGDRDGAFLVLADPQADPAAEFHVPGHHQEFQSVTISPDGRWVAAASRDHLRVFDWKQNATILDQKHKLIRSLAVAPSGKWLAVASDGNVIVYDTRTWQVLREITADSQPIAGLAFHPKFPQFATRSIGGSLKLWETATWQNVFTLPSTRVSQHDHQNPVFSPDGKLLVAARHSETLQLLCTEHSSLRPQPLDSATLSQRAHHFIAQQMWPEAFDSFERSIAAGNAKNWDHVHAAEVATMVNQNDQTRQRLQESAGLAQKVADDDLQLASRLIQAAQLIPDADPAPETSLEIARRAWEEHGGYALAYTLYRQKRDAELVEFMETNRTRLKPSATFPLLHSAALYRLGRVDEANVLFNRAADRYGNQMPLIGRGRNLRWQAFSGFIWDIATYREVRDIALAALNKAIDERPDDDKLILYRGLLHQRWHRWSEAFDDLSRAIDLDADNEDYMESAASVALLAGKLEAADRFATSYASLMKQPDEIESIWIAARVAARISNATCIDEEFLQLVQANARARPGNSWRQVALAGVLHRIGRLDEALAEQDRIAANFSDIGDVAESFLSFRRGIIFHEQGKRDEAVKALQDGEALMQNWLQPPGVFPWNGRHSYVDALALHKELTSLLAADVESDSDPENGDE